MPVETHLFMWLRCMATLTARISSSTKTNQSKFNKSINIILVLMKWLYATDDGNIKHLVIGIVQTTASHNAKSLNNHISISLFEIANCILYVSGIKVNTLGCIQM